MQPKGREFEPRTLHSFLHGSLLLPLLRAAIGLTRALPEIAPAFGVDAPAYVAIRAVMYLAALTVIGSCAFVLLIAPRVSQLSGSEVEMSAAVPSTRRLARWATLLLAFAMVGRLLAQCYMVADGDTLVVLPLLRHTVWGWGWLLGAAATVVIAIALTAGSGSRGSWRAAAAGTIALALSFSITGHAIATSTSPAAHVIFDSIHVMAAGGWLGTLLVVSTIGLHTVSMLAAEKRGHAAAALINTFSTFALICVSTLLVTGVIAAWSHLPTLSALWTTSYGTALLRKLIFVATTGLVGAFNWRYVRPRLTDPETIPLLRRSATVEISIGVIVVILTAILVGTSPPDMDDMPMSRAPHSVQHPSLDRARVDLSRAPSRV